MPEGFDPNLPVNVVKVVSSDALIAKNTGKKTSGVLPGAVGDYVEWKGKRVRNYKRFKKVRQFYSINGLN